MKKYIFIFVFSFIILMFTSKYSFLYPFNDWQDANSFETVARSVLSGKVLYKDIIEQKGPFLYFIYMIGLITSTKFLSGIFIMEVISLGVMLIFVDKIISLFKSYKYSYLVLPLFGVVICTSRAFVHGGSAEEFSLPFLMIGLYYFIKYIKCELNNKEYILNGIICGIVLMIKFNLIGLWLGFMFYMLVNKIMKGKLKNALFNCIFFLLGFLFIIFIILIYFIINNALSDFLFSYFLINVGSYTGESSNLFERVIKALDMGFMNIFYNNICYLLFPLFIISVFKLFKNIKERIGIIFLFIISFFGIYIGLRSFKYYSLSLFIFYCLGFVLLIYLFSDKLNIIVKSKFKYLYLFIYIIFIGFVSYNFANYKNYIGVNKNEFEQYRIADIISKDKNANKTILNYGELDYGFYNILNIIPNCKYFHTMNIDYDRLPDNYDVQNYYVKNGLVDYVIIGVKLKNDDVSNIDGLYDNYDLIYSSYQKYEKYNIHFYLFKLKTVL